MPAVKAISEAHARLGLALRTTRNNAGVSTRSVGKPQPAAAGGPEAAHYSSGHISLVEAGATAPSPELIEAYAAMPGSDGGQLRLLYEQMLAATREAGRRRRQGGEAGPAAVPPRSMDEVGGRHDVQQHYAIVSTDADYRFGPTGAVREVVVTVALRARTPGVRLYYTGFNYPADQRTGVLRIEAAAGATLLSAQESPSGALGCYFQLDREISPEDRDPYSVTFHLAVRSEARAVPCLAYFPSGSSEEFRLRATFAAGARPGSVWWFSVPDLVDAEHPVPGHDVPETSGSYVRSFERLVPGWCYGFAWTW